ncbi:MAG: hypothetical protein H2061_01955 [Burkholderiales bacterium]|nr:hypothetical protein [Burkholderiales bacterium]OUT77562.1 MAG: hypothetical protein CBB82_05280 [Betaproteobacteria bacterium TMED22]|tara:strand:- start:14718 stop:15062 length:345 start_codon:yes stop_codon:yes gene_type:complete
MSNKVPLLLNPFILVGILLVHPLSAAPYPLGTMTCDDIGAFASEAMRWRKEEMITYEDAMTRLDQRTFADPVEKKNLSIVVDYVFGNYGRNWNVESAGNVFRSDCKKGRDDPIE